jgi:putative two-component system response regulator
MKNPIKILVIDDDRILLLALAETLRREGWYQVLTADSGERGIQLAEKNLPNLIICDLMMPPPDGMAVLKTLSQNPITASIPFIFLTARTDEKDKLNGIDLGADDYITKPFNRDELLTRVRALLRRKEITERAERRNAEEEINILRAELRAIMEKYATDHDDLAEAMAQTLFLRDGITEKHSRRGVELAQQLAGELGLRGDIQQQIRLGALLHDIGKIGIPDSILLKENTLTEEERKVMMTHPSLGRVILQPLGLPSVVLDMAYYHHERWDGSGYPEGLTGENIPLVARILAVVDVWDTLTSARPYREAWTREQTIAYIAEQAGTHFDPSVVKKFFHVLARENETNQPFSTQQ